MNINESTRLKGVYLIEPAVLGDNRGYFMETFSESKLAILPSLRFVQDNESFSARTGTLRGLHFQLPPYSQAKLVRVIQGAIYDVVIDLRQDSPTFGQWEGYELTGDNKHMLYIPRGFAHGFQTVTPDVQFVYKCDNLYDKASEGGIIYNDPDLNISWPQATPPILSEKDLILPTFRQIRDSLHTAAQWNTNPRSSVPASPVWSVHA